MITVKMEILKIKKVVQQLERKNKSKLLTDFKKSRHLEAIS